MRTEELAPLLGALSEALGVKELLRVAIDALTEGGAAVLARPSAG